MTLLYANKHRDEMEIKKKIPITVVPQKLKYLGVKLTKEVKNLCNVF